MTRGRDGLLRYEPTAAQRMLWLHAQLDGDDPAYNIAFVARVIGPVDLARLERALATIVGRHESLHTIFEVAGGRPLARVDPRLGLDFEVRDARGRGREAARREVLAIHDRPFDLAAGPALRAGVVALDHEQHVLVISMHHASGDFASLELIMSELGQLYAGAEPATLEPARPYSSQAAREREYLESAAASEARAAWREALRAAPTPPSWPRARAQLGGTHTTIRRVEAELAARLRAFVKDTRTTSSCVVLAAWAIVVGRYAGVDELVVAVPGSTRPRGLRACVGDFVNLLPLRIEPGAAASFRALVEDARGKLWDALGRRELPFDAILELAPTREKIPREGGRNPLAQTLVLVQRPTRFSAWAQLHLEAERMDVRVPWTAELMLAPWPMAQQAGQVDLIVEVLDVDPEPRIQLKSRRAAIPDEDLEQLADALLAALDDGLARADRRPQALALVRDPDRVIAAINREAAAIELGEPTTIVARILAAAARRGPATAIRDARGSLDYAGLEARSRALALGLGERGIAAGDRVGVCMAAGVEAVVAMFAIMRLGAAYVPLDADQPARRLAAIVAELGLRVAITDARGAASLPGSIAALELEHLAPEPSATPRPWPSPSPSPEAIAYTLSTSGSTGVPKAIDVRQRSVVAMIDAVAALLDAGEGDVWAWFHAPTFDLSVWEIWGSLSHGATLVVIPEAERGRTDALVDRLAAAGVGVLVQTPSALRMLAAELERRRGVEVPPLRHVVACGEALPGSTAARMLGHCGALWNMYGPAEATVFTTATRVDAAAAAHEIVALGVPLAHARVYVLDDHLAPVPPGFVGELVIGGEAVAAGYPTQAQLDAARFVPDPFANGAKMYRSGDRAAWDGRTLWFHGRRDGQVKILGHRVELGEVEAALGRIAGVSAVGVIDEATASERRLIAAIVVEDRAPELEALGRAAAELLPGYMIPSRFVIVDALPLSGHGKLDRAALRGLIAARPDVHHEAQIDPGADELERAIAAIWARVLERPQVGLDQGFFELGGSSLALMEVHAALVELPGAGDLRPSELFEHPSVRALARRIRGRSQADARPPARRGARRAAASHEASRRRARHRAKP